MIKYYATLHGAPYGDDGECADTDFRTIAEAAKYAMHTLCSGQSMRLYRIVGHESVYTAKWHADTQGKIFRVQL